MTREDLELLASVRVVAPCPMKWRDLEGNDKTRFCRQCRLHVHRLSKLTFDEAVALVRASRTERVCVQLVYRLDGTVMTKGCPSAWDVGVAEAVRRVGPAVGVGSVMGLGVVMLVAAAISVVVLFGDSIRKFFGPSLGGALAADEAVTQRAPPIPAASPHHPPERRPEALAR